MSSKLSPIESLNWKTSEYQSNHVYEAIQNTDWVKLCELASRLNHNLPCVALDKITNGLNNLVRLLEFSNQTRWVARINLCRSGAASTKLRGEVDVMQLIKDRSQLQVPQVFAYEVDKNNPIGMPFILMEFVPGNTGMDAAGGYEVHRGQIPLTHRPTLYKSVAECHVQMTALRFSKIGSIVRSRDGDYNIGPLPGIGGPPFDTATEFFKAWAEHARFPKEEDKILEMMEGGPAQKVLKAINDFPAQIKAMASRLSQHNNHGPFPLCHADFLHSNMIINESFEVVAVIDWENACTVPLELVAFPAFLYAMPAQFCSPEDYDEHGLPLDDEEQQRWKEREEYAQMVQAIEQKDHVLSACLNDKNCLALAYCIGAYGNGKLGFYDNVIELQNRQSNNTLKTVDWNN